MLTSSRKVDLVARRQLPSTFLYTFYKQLVVILLCGTTVWLLQEQRKEEGREITSVGRRMGG